MGKTRAKARRNAIDNRREFPMRTDESQMYAKVTKLVGSGRVMAKCTDGVERTCRIRGAMIGRDWVYLGDVILVSVRSFEPRADVLLEPKADVLFKYQAHEIDRLKKWGEPVAFEGEVEEEGVDAGVATTVVFEEIDDI